MTTPFTARIKSSGKYLYQLHFQGTEHESYFRYFRANNMEEATAFAAGWISASNLPVNSWGVSSQLTYPRELKGRDSWGDAKAEQEKVLRCRIGFAKVIEGGSHA